MFVTRKKARRLGLTITDYSSPDFPRGQTISMGDTSPYGLPKQHFLCRMPETGRLVSAGSRTLPVPGAE